MNRTTFVLLLFTLTSHLEAQGVGSPLAPDQNLSLTAAVEIAIENSFSLGAERARLQALRERHGAAKAEYRPMASLALRATEFENPMVITPIHGFSPGVTPLVDTTILQGAVDFSLLLYDGEARRSLVRQTEAQVGAARHSLAEAQQDVALNTIRTYLQILGKAEILRAHDRRLEALRSEAARVQQLFSVGRVAEVEVLRIAAAVAEAEAERVVLAADQEIVERDLARLLRLEVERVPAELLTGIALRDQVLEARDELLARAMATNLVIREGRAQLLAAEAGIENARSSRRPNLTAMANLTDYGSSLGDFTTEWWVGLRLAMPLFTGGRTSRKIGGAEASRDEVAERLREAEQRLAKSVDHAIAAWRVSVAREKSLGAALLGFSAVAASEKLRLENGVGTPTDFLDAEADLLKTKANLTLARNAMILARAELARILGELDAPWITDHLREVSAPPSTPPRLSGK